jgi:hypothetical protein
VNPDPISEIAGLILRPKIVKRYPGELHVRLPGLKQLDRHSPVAREILEEFSDIFPGVSKFSLQVSSGNVLIHYDTALTDDRRIVSSIVTIIKTAVAHRKELSRMAPARHAAIIGSIKEYLSGVEPSLLQSEEPLALPDEVWS